MTKKIWKLTEKAAQFINSVCPDEVTAAQLAKKAYVCFNSEQTCVDFTLAALNPGEILECKATIRLWRKECCVLDKDDEIDRPWELTAEEIAELDEDEDYDRDDNNADERKRVNVHVIYVGKSKAASDGEKKDCE